MPASASSPTRLRAEATATLPVTPGAKVQFAVLQKLLERPGKHYSPRRIWAGLRALGLDLEDVDPAALKQPVQISPLIGKEDAANIVSKRQQVKQELQEQRRADLRKKLDSLTDEEVLQFERYRGGKPSAPAPTDVEDFMEHKRKKLIEAAGESFFTGDAEQDCLTPEERRALEVQEKRDRAVKRKADAVAKGFLHEQKRQADAEKKMAEMEQRVKDFVAQRKAQIEQKKKQDEKKFAAARENVDKLAAQNEAKRDEMEAALTCKLDTAQQHRESELSWESRKKRAASERARSLDEKRGQSRTAEEWKAEVERKQLRIIDECVEKEMEMIRRIQERDNELSERFDEKKRIKDERTEESRRDQMNKYQSMQVHLADFAMKKEEQTKDNHLKFVKRFDDNRKRAETDMKQRSASCGKLLEKDMTRWKAGYEKVIAATQERNDALMEKHERAAENRKAIIAQGLKNGIDINTFREIRHNTYGDLQRRRLEEVQRAQDAKEQKTLFQVAAGCARRHHHDTLHQAEVHRRAELHKHILMQNDHAQDTFVKMRSCKDEAKIIAAMNSLGFDMPRLPEEEEEKEEDEKKPAF